MRRHHVGFIVCSSLLTAALAAGVAAQQPGGQGRGGGAGGGSGRGGGGGFGRGGGQGRMFGGRMGGPLTVTRAPATALQKPLSLSADQVKKITDIQSKAFAGLFPGRGPGGGPGGGGPGRGPGGRGPGGGAPAGGPPPGAPAGGPPGAGRGPGGGPPGGIGGPGGVDFQQIRERMQAADKKASKEIEAVLTSSQRSKLPAVLKELETARNAGIPVEVVADLKLTPDQTKKLDAVAKEAVAKRTQMMQGGGGGGDRQAMFQAFQKMRDENRKKVDAILTPGQRDALKKYEDAHPRGRGGRGGGPGGPGGGARAVL